MTIMRTRQANGRLDEKLSSRTPHASSKRIKGIRRITGVLSYSYDTSLTEVPVIGKNCFSWTIFKMNGEPRILMIWRGSRMKRALDSSAPKNLPSSMTHLRSSMTFTEELLWKLRSYISSWAFLNRKFPYVRDQMSMLSFPERLQIVSLP